MKRKILSILAAVLLLCCTACSAAPSGEDRVEGDVKDLLAKVTDGATDPELSLVTADVTEENFQWYFFVEPIDGAEGVVSEPMIGSIPHCIALLRVPAGSDAEAVRSEIEENLDPRKWVCVEAEKTAVLRRGDLILLAMSDAAAVDKAVENFNAL